MKRYKNLFFFLIAVLIISSVSYMRQDIERLFEIEAQAEKIMVQDSSIEFLEVQLNIIEIELKEKESNIRILIDRVEKLKKIIEHEKNRRDNNGFIILDILSVDTGADGHIIRISK